MKRFLLHIVLNGIALWLAAQIVPGIHYSGGILYLLLAGLVFGIVNALVKPIVTVLSLPLIVLTLGLFFLVINALMLYVTAWFLSGFKVDGFLAALLGGLVIALFNWAVGALTKG